MSFTNAEIFMIFAGAVAYGHWLGTRVRAYAERRKRMAKEEEVRWEAQKALLARDIRLLKKAEEQGLPLEPLHAKMNRQVRTLDASFEAN